MFSLTAFTAVHSATKTIEVDLYITVAQNQADGNDFNEGGVRTTTETHAVNQSPEVP